MSGGKRRGGDERRDSRAAGMNGGGKKRGGGRAHAGLPPATAYHRWPMRLANGALRALNNFGFARISLAEESLIAAARKQAGLAEFGDESFREPLAVLLQSLEQEAELNPLGRWLTRQSLVRLLRNRLLAHDLLTRRPEILELELAPPVVVAGLGRSGTTRLHRLLAADARFNHLRSWESVHPVPWPESYAAARKPGTKDPREKNIEQALKAVLYMSPQMAAVHPLDAAAAEEEIGLIQHGFSTQLFEVMAKVPAFAEWLMSRNQFHAYEYMAALLKIINWFRGDPPGKPWVLKSPQHMQDLDALLHVFPDARLIFAHRDPVKVVGSLCSTSWNSLVRDTDYVNPAAIGPGWLSKADRMLRKTLNLRDSAVAPERQWDAFYHELGADWRGVMAGAYEWLEMPFTAEAQRGMEAWLARNAQHRHGAHHYRLEDFGLDAAQVDERLMYYRERFAIPYEE